MQNKRNILVVVVVRTLVCVGLLAGAIGILTLLVKTKPQPGRSNTADAAPRVAVMPARSVEIRRRWEGFGTAAAMDTANVPARVTATVIEVPTHVEPGARVEAGELLVALDDTDFVRQVEIATHNIAEIDAQLARMEIELASWTKRTKLAEERVQLAQNDFDRFMEAARSGGVRPGEIDQARQVVIAAVREEVSAREELDKLPARRAGLEALRLRQQSERQIAEENVKRCRIASPIGGLLQEVDVEIGESLVPGQRVARVVDVDRIEILLRLPAAARAAIRAGDTARVTAAGSGGRSESNRGWTAPIARIAPADDEITRTVTVYVEVEQDGSSPGAIAPGQFVRGTVASAVPQVRWVVPRRALSGDRLLFVRDGRIDSGEVEVDFQAEGAFPELGVPDEEWVVLAEPLVDGELVVVVPTRALLDGARVEPVIAGDARAAHLRSARDGEESPQ